MKKIGLVLFLFFITSFAFSQGHIKKFEFSGLKRTRESYLLKVLKKYVGTEFNEETSKAMEKDLREEGLFSEIAIQDEPDGNGGTSVKITLKEKISFLVLPFGSYTNDGPMGGAAMLDQNAFGIRDTFLLGGMIAKDSFTVMSSYRRPSLDATHPGFSASGAYSKEKTKIADLDGDTMYKIDNGRLHLELEINDRVFPCLVASFGVGYTGNYFKDKDLDNIHQVLFNPSVKYSSSDWNGVFTSEKSLEVSLYGGCNNDGDFVTAEKIKGCFQQPIVSRLRFAVEACLSYEKEKAVINQQTRSNVSTNLLPSDFHSPEMLSSGFSLELAALQTKYAMLSIYGAWQIVISEDYDGSTDFSYGPGGGLRVYLSTINLPAVGVGLYYNIPHHVFEFGVSMGVSF